MKYNISIIAICAVTLVLPGCKKFMEIPPPTDKLSTQAIFSDSVNATSAISYIYTNMGANPSIDNLITFSTGIGGDELVNNNTSDTYQQFLTDNVLIDNSNVNSVWSNAYALIYAANNIIEGVNHSTNISVGYKNQLTGEAKFCRALQYFYLVNLFGDVPLVTTTDYTQTASLARTSRLTVYASIVEDLLDAQSKMGTAYAMAEKVRPNKWAATALLARVYLYQQDWVNAETQASAVINSGMYSIAAIGSAFLKTSSETIWQLYPTQVLYNVPEANNFVPNTAATSKPAYSITASLYNDFETGDARKTNWTGVKNISGVNYPYAFKYKIKTGTNTTATEYPIMLRLAEQYLVRAEARAQQNKLSGTASAQADINMIRARAGLLPSAAISQSDVLLAIEKERRSELFTDRGGHRWFDLVRTGRANTILGNYKGANWQPTDALWPIPSAQISLNKALTQNAGY